MKAYALTDVGKERNTNQDTHAYTTDKVGRLENLFAVADGMGGHSAGDVASRFTVEKLFDVVRNDRTDDDAVSIMVDAVKTVNTMLYDKAGSSLEYNGMGTTLVAATIEGDSLKVVNVGDSRLYLIEDDILQVTRDHSLVEEMVSRGQINKTAARNHVNKNVITRAVGAERDIVPEAFAVDLLKDSLILMCTDGLTNMITDREIFNIIKSGRKIQDIVENLVAAANMAGGRDNITAMLIDCGDILD